MVTITDRDRGYWEAICDFAFLGGEDFQLAELIATSSLTREECATLMDENKYEADRLRPIVQSIKFD